MSCGLRTGRTSVLVLVGLTLVVRPAPGQVRDRNPVGQPAVGSAVLRGTIVAAGDEERTVRRAVVSLTGGPQQDRALLTDDEGRFAFEGLPAGRYTITVTKAGYLQGAYGARRPGRPGTPVVVGATDRLDVRVALSRGAVVEGTIYAESGRPLPGVRVFAAAPGDERLGGSGDSSTEATTDDRGRYRIFGLPPGRRVIAAVASIAGAGGVVVRSDDEVDAMLARLAAGRSQLSPSPFPGTSFQTSAGSRPARTVDFPVMFYPGVTRVDEATVVTLATGEERRGLDFTVAPVPTVTVSGTVAASGQPLPPVQLSYLMDGPRLQALAMSSAGSRPVLTVAPDADGRFEYTNVAPGRYTILARGGGTQVRPEGPVGASPPAQPLPIRFDRASDSEDALYGMAEVEVFGQDVAGVAVVLRPGVTLSGRIELHSATATPPESLGAIRLNVRRPGSSFVVNRDGTMSGNTIFNSPGTEVEADGTFRATGTPPGTYDLRFTVPDDIGSTWWLRSAMLNGRDLLDAPLEIGAVDLAGIVVTLTDQRNELAGSLQTAAGIPAPDYFIVAYPTDREFWRPDSRRITSTRPDTNGAFSILHLPAGQYLVSALTDLEPSDLSDATFLEELATQSVPVVIRDGERTTQNLQIAN